MIIPETSWMMFVFIEILSKIMANNDCLSAYPRKEDEDLRQMFERELSVIISSSLIGNKKMVEIIDDIIDKPVSVNTAIATNEDRFSHRIQLLIRNPNFAKLREA